MFHHGYVLTIVGWIDLNVNPLAFVFSLRREKETDRQTQTEKQTETERQTEGTDREKGERETGRVGVCADLAVLNAIGFRFSTTIGPWLMVRFVCDVCHGKTRTQRNTDMIE